jgi:hypothetical protein
MTPARPTDAGDDGRPRHGSLTRDREGYATAASAPFHEKRGASAARFPRTPTAPLDDLGASASWSDGPSLAGKCAHHVPDGLPAVLGQQGGQHIPSPKPCVGVAVSSAVVYETFGGPEVRELMEVPEPHAGPGEVRVRVTAAGLNPMDWQISARPEAAARWGLTVPARSWRLCDGARAQKRRRDPREAHRARSSVLARVQRTRAVAAR